MLDVCTALGRKSVNNSDWIPWLSSVVRKLCCDVTLKCVMNRVVLDLLIVL
jgi:hypothetical protein